MSGNIADLYIELTKNIGNPEKRKEIRKRIDEEEHRIFLEKTKCNCGVQMKDVGSWTTGDRARLGGRCYTTMLFQCPKCKDVKIIHD